MTTSRSRRRRGGSRWPIYLLVVVLAIVGVVVFAKPGWFDMTSQTASVPAPVATASPAPTGIRALPADEQLQIAIQAAFGAAGKAVSEHDGNSYDLVPRKLVWRGDDSAVLIAESTMRDGCHGCSGGLVAYYLKPQGDSFTVVQRYLDAVTGSSNGQPPLDWSVSEDYAEDPVIYATGGGTFQGYTCGVFTLTELREDGPSGMLSAPITYDDGGAAMSDGATSLEGRVVNVVPGKSFGVRYSGSADFTDVYVRQGNRYVAKGEARMQGC